MNTIRLVKTTNTDPDFLGLVKKLNAELAILDGDEHDFYNQYNGLDNIKHILVAYIGEIPVGCGAIKIYDDSTMEVKRMYTSEKHRNKGVAIKLLTRLEHWAAELGYTTTILETGLRQEAAIALYYKAGYELISNYGQYAGVENSRCFEKKLLS